METGTTKALSYREARGQLATKSSRRIASTTVTSVDVGHRGHVVTDEHVVWSTDASRHAASAEKSRSRSVEARCGLKCHGHLSGSESMETLDVRLLSPDSGAIVFGESPENETAMTSIIDRPDCSHNEVRDSCSASGLPHIQNALYFWRKVRALLTHFILWALNTLYSLGWF